MDKGETFTWYQIRYDGGGGFDYFIFDPQNDELPYDCTDLEEVKAVAKEAPYIVGHPVWIVEIVETRL